MILINFKVSNKSTQRYKNILTSAHNKNFDELKVGLNKFKYQKEAIEVIYNYNAKIIDGLFNHILNKSTNSDVKQIANILNCVTNDRDLEVYLIRMYTMFPGPYFYNVLSYLEKPKILEVLFKRTQIQWEEKYSGFYESIIDYLKKESLFPYLNLDDVVEDYVKSSYLFNNLGTRIVIDDHFYAILESQIYAHNNSFKINVTNYAEMSQIFHQFEDFFQLCFVYKMNKKTFDMLKSINYPFDFTHQMLCFAKGKYDIAKELNIIYEMNLNRIVKSNWLYFPILLNFINTQFIRVPKMYPHKTIHQILQSARQYDILLKDIIKKRVNHDISINTDFSNYVQFEMTRKEADVNFLKSLIEATPPLSGLKNDMIYSTFLSKHQDLFEVLLFSIDRKLIISDSINYIFTSKYIVKIIKYCLEKTNLDLFNDRLDVLCDNLYNYICSDKNVQSEIDQKTKKIVEHIKSTVDSKDKHRDYILLVCHKLEQRIGKKGRNFYEKYEAIIKSQFNGKVHSKISSTNKFNLLQSVRNYRILYKKLSKIKKKSEMIKYALVFEIARKEPNNKFLDKLHQFTMKKLYRYYFLLSEREPYLQSNENHIKIFIRYLKNFYKLTNINIVLNRLDFVVKNMNKIYILPDLKKHMDEAFKKKGGKFVILKDVEMTRKKDFVRIVETFSEKMYKAYQ